MLSFVFTDLVNRHDSWMVQAGCRFGFRMKSSDVVLRGQLTSQNHLQSYIPVRFVLPSPIDNRHSAAAQLLENLVTGNLQALPCGLICFRCLSADGIVAWAMVRQGLGISVMTRDIAALAPEIEMILPDAFPAIPIPTWLTTHRELHTSRRIRLVFDLLAETFG